jgi:hypothetical protein
MFSRFSRLAVFLAGSVILAACGDSTTAPPDDPDDPGPAVSYELTVTLNSVEAIDVCEEAFTDFDGGEFIYRFRVTWPNNTQVSVKETAGYPNVSNYVTLKPNQPLAANVSQKFTGPGSGAIGIQLRASEVDFDLFGNNPTADSRMNDANVSTQHAWTGSAWQTGDFDMTLAPANGCRIRARYSVGAVAK